jgi:predicted nuclease of predicted toxin-antitoxin system
VPGRFPLFTDNHVRQQIIEGLVREGWDVVRAIDVFPEATDDEILFPYAAEQGRVFVTCDKRIHAIAIDRLKAGQPFRMIFWRLERHRRMSDGDFVRAFEEIAKKPDAFAYAIEYVKPKP